MTDFYDQRHGAYSDRGLQSFSTKNAILSERKFASTIHRLWRTAARARSAETHATFRSGSTLFCEQFRVIKYRSPVENYKEAYICALTQ